MTTASQPNISRRELVGGAVLLLLAAIGFGGWAFATDRIEGLQGELAQQEGHYVDRIKTLKAQRADADARRAQLASRVDRLELRNKRLNDRIGMLEDALDKARQNKDQASQDIETLQQRVSGLEQANQSLEKALSKSRERTASLRDELTQYRGVSGGLDELEQELASIHQDRERAVANLEATVSDAQDVRTRLEQRREALQRVTEKLEARRQALADVDALGPLEDPLAWGAIWLTPGSKAATETD